MPQIYKITYPNGKIYVGSDLTDCIVYFGSVCSAYVLRDFSREQRKSFTITKDILWEGEGTKSEVTKLEHAYIRQLNANDPSIGYNRNRRRRA